MVGVEATMDAQPATEQGIPGVAGEVQRRRKRRRNAEAADKKERNVFSREWVRIDNVRDGAQ